MKLKQYDWIIGVDPDVDKLGVSFLDTEVKIPKLTSPTLTEFITYLKRIKTESQRLNKNTIIVIEGGWNHTRTHRRSKYDNFGTASKKGYNVGRNHQRGMDIFQIAEYIGLEVTEQMPLKKIWKGREGKITHEELAYFTGIEAKRTNQEERDATLIAWNYANFPIRVNLINIKRL